MTSTSEVKNDVMELAYKIIQSKIHTLEIEIECFTASGKMDIVNRLKARIVDMQGAMEVIGENEGCWS